MTAPQILWILATLAGTGWLFWRSGSYIWPLLKGVVIGLLIVAYIGLGFHFFTGHPMNPEQPGACMKPALISVGTTPSKAFLDAVLIVVQVKIDDVTTTLYSQAHPTRIAAGGIQALRDWPGSTGAQNALPELTVWYGPMPESNGRSNFTAVLHRKDAEGFDIFTDGFQFARSEYPDRVRYEADCMRYLIGELAERPFILDYDADKHSGYIKPEPAGAQNAEAIRNHAETDAARDVLAERRRQVDQEGWTPERDDKYINCELARAAATYATCSHIEQLKLCGEQVWPWHPDWWKRSTYRRDLTKAGALILAEIERIDRDAIRALQSGTATSQTGTANTKNGGDK
jgi:hypothetical protein